jgi:TolB-like protein/Tfp pilus assembly protein PilF
LDQRPELAREQLAILLNHALFRRAPRQSEFLRLIVENQLRTDPVPLSEHDIGVTVYERRPDYDTREDPIVRVEAARLRARLREYYSGPGSADSIQFELPKGTYTPLIRGACEAVEKTNVAETGSRGNLSPLLKWRWGLWVLGVCLLAVIALALRQQRLGAGVDRPSRVVAVLPFEDLSPDKVHSGFCEGLTAEITDVLSRGTALRVVGSSSAESLARQRTELPEAGRRMGVTHLLEGAVRGDGSRFRITARLIDAKTGFQLWASTLDKTVEDQLLLQDEIAQAIARALQVRLDARREDEGKLRSPRRLRAHALFMEARGLHRRMSPLLLPEAVRLHEEAVREDDSYALAHSGLAHAYVSLMSAGLERPARLREAAWQRARRAVELDPGLADAYSAIVRLARDVDYDWMTARKTCTDGLAVAPNSASLFVNCGTLYSLLGLHEDAEQSFQQSMRLDPLWAGGGAAHAESLLRAGRHLEAEARIRAVRSAHPEFAPAALGLARVLAVQGRYSEAMAVLDERSGKGLELSAPDFALLAYLTARAGESERSAQLEEKLKEMARKGQLQLESQALVRMGAGDTAGTLELLEAAVSQQDTSLGATLADPLFAPLRQHPRFVALRRSLNLP